jgi:DNA polymerase-3 subunit delta'
LRFDLAWQASQDEGASKNLTLNIKTVRVISRHVALRPSETRWRVVIVDDVETMQETAQEAFLKTVEEPPPYVVILMLCTDAELLLPTILSRCSIVTMAPATDAVVAQALRAHGAEDDLADRIAVAVRGRVGLALRALEDQSLLETMSEHVSEAVSWVSGDPYARAVAAYQLAERYSADREVVFDRLMATQAAWRELLIAGANTVTGARHPVLDSVAPPAVDDAGRAIVATDRCIRDLEANVRPRAALATMVQSWPELTAR